MKVLVCGSRSWFDKNAVRARIEDLPMGTRVVVGDARGADALAEEAATACGLLVSVFAADWERHGKRAGALRNLAMLDEEPHLVIAFCRDKSPGTSLTVREAERRGIPVELYEEDS